MILRMCGIYENKANFRVKKISEHAPPALLNPGLPVTYLSISNIYKSW